MQVGLGVLGFSGITENHYIISYLPIVTSRAYASQAVSTIPSDNPSSTFIRGGVKIPVEISRTLTTNDDGRFSGASVQSVVDFDIINTDGELDEDFLNLVFRDRPVTLKVGYTTRLPSGLEQPPMISRLFTAFSGYVVNVQVDRDVVKVHAEDGMKRLLKPIQGKTYQGHGGRNGGPDLAGQQPPLCYGFNLNVKPTLVDALRGIYQLHDGEIKSIRAVKDRAVNMVYVKNVDTYDQLAALVTQGETGEFDIGVGQFATCLAEGFFRIGGTAGGLITADVEGDGINDGAIPFDNKVLWDQKVGWAPVGSNTHSKYAGGIIFRILATRGGFSATELDIDRFAQFDKENPFEMGVFIPSGKVVTIGDLCAAVADSVCGVLTRTRQGKVTVTSLQGPASGFMHEFTQHDMSLDSLETMALPYGAAWPTIRISYGRNNTQMTEDQLSAEVTGTDREFFTRDTSYYEYHDSSVVSLLPDRAPLVVQTALRHEQDAKTIAARYAAMYHPKARMYQVGVKGVNFQLEHLETVKLSHPRYGLAAGRRLQVVAIGERLLDNETHLTLFG